ncbi:unnamed protein product [Aureobasidium mustum]|uniref:Uncharacterized protein n=1 Tax=Aureobasidium mustum TaxID=2773714 RepID=A0A9N8PJK2_9PEZI|nr:unnamed protein product [Aureobasidium mustum]
MKYVRSMEELDQVKHALDISEIVIDPDLDRSKKKGKSKQKAKAKEKISGATNDQTSAEAQTKYTKPLVLKAKEFFRILYHAVEDGQDTTYLEKKYFRFPLDAEDEMFINKEDYELMKEWSVKYKFDAATRRVHEVVGAQTRKNINKEYHLQVVNHIFQDLSTMRDNIREDVEDGDLLRYYESLFVGLSILVLELARSDLSSKTDDAELEYGLEVD